MWRFVRSFHNRRPLLWSVIAFVLVVCTATALTVWWNVLLVQNHRVAKTMAAAANNPKTASFPLALLMVIGLLCSLGIVLGLVYMFLRLIRTVQLNLAQSQFIAAVTHELKSPVASLQIMLETIRDPSTPAPKRKEFEDCMDADIKRLRVLVDQVLDTARLETFVRKDPGETIALKRFLELCAREFETRLRTTGSQLTITEVPEHLALKGSRQLLASAIANVLDNAVKYSHGPAVIAIDVVPMAKSIAIDVADRGIGIPRKEQHRVFKRFYRAPEAMLEGKPGTGLGLYFTRLALLAQGGKVSVRDSDTGQGTVFRLELPRPRSRLGKDL